MSHERELADIRAQMSSLLEDAYARGFADGGAAMRDNILKAASAPLEQRSQSHYRLKAEPGSYSLTGFSAPSPKQRARRGSVRILVDRILNAQPGLTTGEIGDGAAAIDNDVSPSSVSNELRRYEGIRYRRDGRRWFLIGNAERETAEEAVNGPSAAHNPEAVEGGETDRTALAPSRA
jgi:hypothetical protein